ncbi:MAG: PD-(D/E)XK nuclease family protein [Elusimicrobiota bacterium]|nr:PD-(D/E)XK nuclease family protein [Elusimicrobiota bacterium]
MEISFTRWRVYRECPWKYKLLFLDGRRIPPTPKGSFGVSLHRALEAWTMGGDDSLDALLEALDAHWQDYGYGDEAEEARWRSKAERVLTRFQAEAVSRRSRVVASEKEFVWRLGDHQVRGMIDRVDQRPDGAYEVVDYKTGPDAPTAEQVAADPQLRFYALGARRGLGIAPAFVTVEAVTAGATVTAAYDGEGEEALAADVAAAAAAIEAGRFTPEMSFCPRCDFRRDCVFSSAKNAP